MLTATSSRSGGEGATTPIVPVSERRRNRAKIDRSADGSYRAVTLLIREKHGGSPVAVLTGRPEHTPGRSRRAPLPSPKRSRFGFAQAGSLKKSHPGETGPMPMASAFLPFESHFRGDSPLEKNTLGKQPPSVGAVTKSDAFNKGEISTPHRAPTTSRR